MKRIALFFYLFLGLVIIFSCNNEPVDFEFPTQENEDLFGEWFLLEFSSEIVETNSVAGQLTTSETRIAIIDANYRLVLDPTSATVRGNYGYAALSSVEDTPIINDFFSFENVNATFDYSFNTNEVVSSRPLFLFPQEGIDDSLFNGQQVYSYTISEDKQTLICSQNITSNQTDPSTGITISNSKRLFSVWTKDESLIQCEFIQATAAAAAAYNLNPEDTQLCFDYRMAIEDQIRACGDPNGRLREIIDSLDRCGLLSGDILIVTVNNNTINFTDKVITYENGIITTEGSSPDGNNSIYFQVEENVTGDGSVQNFRITINGIDYFPAFPGNINFRFVTLISSNFNFGAVFDGTVESAQGDTRVLSVGVVNVNYF